MQVLKIFLVAFMCNVLAANASNGEGDPAGNKMEFQSVIDTKNVSKETHQVLDEVKSILKVDDLFKHASQKLKRKYTIA